MRTAQGGTMMTTEKLYETDGMLSGFPPMYSPASRMKADMPSFSTAPPSSRRAADRARTPDDRRRPCARCTNPKWRNPSFHECSRFGEVPCALDFDVRFRKMQNHLGEHLLCGAIHRLYGFDNVGFHLGADYMTFDIDGALTPEQIAEVEKKANRAVFEDVPVRCWYPKKDELSELDYRAKSEKLGAAGAVRIVEAAGFDRCACCAPHLDRTGRVGCIKITDAVKYKGGMRFHALCGSDALADYGKKQDTLGVLSRLLSAKEDSITEAVEARLAELVRAKQTVAPTGAHLSRRGLRRCPMPRAASVFLSRCLTRTDCVSLPRAEHGRSPAFSPPSPARRRPATILSAHRSASRLGR